MADPTPYVQSYNFSDGYVADPSQYPAQSFDAQFAAIQAAFADAVSAIMDVRRADGKLQNDSVSVDSISDDVVNQFLGKIASLDAVGALYAALNLADLQSVDAALTNLGMSTFFKTLLASASQVALRTALGAGTGNGNGTVTSVAVGDGLGGGPITSAGTLLSYGYPMQGRLSLTTGVPVMPAAVSTASTVYWTPYNGRLVSLWDGTDFKTTKITGDLSNVLANAVTGFAGPAIAAVSSLYDLFVWNNAGTPTLTRGPAWTNATTRSLSLNRVNGLLVNAADIANGPAAGFGTYVGTIATDAALTSGNATCTFDPGGAASGGHAAFIGLWNEFNRVEAPISVNDSSAFHTYSSATHRIFNNSNNNRITFVRGQAEDRVLALFVTMVNSVGPAAIALLVDATTVHNGYSNFSATQYADLVSAYSGDPGIGLHFIQALEWSDGTHAQNFYSGVFMHFSASVKY